MRNAARALKPFIGKNSIVLSSSKGLEEAINNKGKKIYAMFGILKEESGKNIKIAVMSGSNLAGGIEKENPTIVVVSSKNKEAIREVSHIYSGKTFKVVKNGICWVFLFAGHINS